MKLLLTGAAVAALAISPIHAQGKGHGQGNGGGHGNGGGQGHAMQGPSMHGPSMQGQGHGNSGHGSKAPAMQTAAHGNGHGMGNGHGKGHGDPPVMAAHNEPHGNSSMAHAEKGARGKSLPHGNGNARAVPQTAASNGGVKVLKDGRHYYAAPGSLRTIDFPQTRRGLIDGCPPGLAKKNNGCQPPGLAKQRAYQPNWWGMSNLSAGPYYYDNGYLLRMNGGSVAGYLPLLGGALSVGNVWPSMYAPVAVPPYYVDYYGLGPAGSYRYADNVLYNVDPSTSAISSVAALLTGDTFRIGGPLPVGYDVYNVPYGYRSQYVDGPSAWYRYSDGYIYQVDPTTQLITAMVQALV